MDEIILEVKNLKKYFIKNKGIIGKKKQIVKAVDDISFNVKKGETFGLVGESGSGKTTVGRSIIKLYDFTSGEVFYKGERISVGNEQLLEIEKEFRNLNKETKGRMNEVVSKLNYLKAEYKKVSKVDPKDSKLKEIQKLIDEENTKLKDLNLEIKSRNIKNVNEAKPGFRKSMQMIFQDPYASLNARMTVADIITEPMVIHNLLNPAQRKKRVFELLEMVGLNRQHASRYPHEFSGGQRQRIGIARALAVNPEFIICDEPISALDVSIQAQIINLLEELQERLGLTYMFIAHDLSMVKHISNRIAVMYLGKIVEITSSQELFKNPLHPYTVALLSAVPVPSANEEDRRDEIILEGDIPSPINPPSGCRFRTRCRFACDRCKNEEPMLREISDGHVAACHLLDK